MRLRGIAVLVVEDDPDNLELMASYLDGEGARTLSAGSIAAALAMTKVVRVDVVVADLELLDGNGCELLKQLRDRDGMNELPAIAITGYSDKKRREQAENCGFVRYAEKPFSLERLVAWIVELSGPAASGVRGEPSAAAEFLGVRGRLSR
jgi:two-component system CheB/CheR fusion protein